MALSSLIGQETAVAALKAALARNAVPHSYLFLGLESVGKTTAAVEFAKVVCCKAPLSPPEACGSCANCNRIAANEHPDIVRIAPDGEFTKIWQLWSRPGHPAGALETLSFAPVAAPKRFYIIEKAETLNEEAANSLLKALEEPPPYVNFILCAPSPTAVLPTILSRCQIIRFQQAPMEAIARALVTRQGLTLTDARVIAAYSQGAPGRAFRLAETPELKDQRENLLALAERIAFSPGIAAFKLAEDLRNGAKPGKAKKGEEAEGDGDRTARGDLGRAVEVLAAWHSDLLAVALRGPNAPVIHEDRRDALVKAAARYRPEQLVENVETLFTFRRHIARNANAQLATEILMLRLTPKKGPAGASTRQ
jgi:DNA polymerase III subunit delta'